MFLQNRSYWSELVSEIYNKLESDEEGIQKEIPKDLCKAVQEPLITRWWTQSVLASLYTKYSKVYNATAQATVNSTTTADKSNKISSNLVRMADDKWIVADVFFLSGVSGERSKNRNTRIPLYSQSCTILSSNQGCRYNGTILGNERKICCVLQRIQQVIHNNKKKER